LFNLYRQFYQCPADLGLAKDFISARISNDESVIFLAQESDADSGTGLGFVQLYPSFCSVEAVKIFILYDLYVDQNGRQQGIGKALMNAAKQHAAAEGAGRLDLLTAHSNTTGQRLYEKLGYKQVNQDFYAYSLGLEQG